MNPHLFAGIKGVIAEFLGHDGHWSAVWPLCSSSSLREQNSSKREVKVARSRRGVVLDISDLPFGWIGRWVRARPVLATLGGLASNMRRILKFAICRSPFELTD
jgi:hypothetical protein